MSDKIEVGDRVRTTWGEEGIVLGIHTNSSGERWLWTEFDKSHQCWGFTDEQFTRIEPEKVVLTPKYAVAQRLRTSPLRLNITADNIYVVKSPAVGYELESGGWLPESLLFPVPTPCPTCKGSGKASE